MPNRIDLIEDALDIWAPGYPRRVTRNQFWANSRGEAVDALLGAESAPRNEPYISTYSFPRGHTKEKETPDINTLFIDFDFEGGDYNGDGDRDAWRRDLSHLLVRVRLVARFLNESGNSGWRASLSGHKGVHLFLDFPTIDPGAGNFQQFLSGLGDYADELTDRLAEQTSVGDLDTYVDVTSSDLGRLCRVPNTQHNAATEAFGEPRYCVPVTLDELANITVDTYEQLTSEPREVPWKARQPNDRVGQIIAQHVTTATEGTQMSSGGVSNYNHSRVESYKEASNDDIELADLPLLLERPCVWRFHERRDKYQHGYQSHYAELFCIRELVELNTPIEVIKDFLNNSPEYNEQYSEQKIKQVIARDYNRFTIEAMLKNAPEFCGYDGCRLCNHVSQQLQDSTS